MKTFKITEETMMAVFNYLQTRPYAEVEKLINGIRQTAQNEIVAPAPAPMATNTKVPKKK